MRKIFFYLTLFCFSFTAIAAPISEIKSILPSFIATSHAEDEGLPAVSEELSEHEQDLVDYCMAETDKSEAECTTEVQNETLSADQANEVSQQTGEFLSAYDTQHGLVMMIISAAISIISTIISFVGFLGWRFPSNYLSLAANCVIMIFFWMNLAKFHKVVKEAEKVSYKNKEEIKQTQFINDQIAILKNAKPIVKSINTSLKVVIGISIATVVAALAESIACVSGVIWLCACNKNEQKNNSPLRFIKQIFPTDLHATTTEELETQKEEAKAKVQSSKVSISVNAWRRVVFEIVRVVLLSTLGFWIVDQIAKKIFKEAGSKAAGKILAFVKVVFYSLDLKTYIKMKNMYQSADEEINRRIKLLKKFEAEIESATSSGSGISGTDSSAGGPEGVGLDIGSTNNTNKNLGEGQCQSFNYKTAETKDGPCGTATTTFPKSKKPTNGGIKSLDAYMDSLDPNPIFENISKAATTQEGVAAGEFSKNAKRLKKVIPKLLKMLKKKGIKFSKDQKAKNVKPLYLQILEEGKKQDQFVASLANDLLNDAGINKPNLKESPLSPEAKSREVFDDKKSNFKMPEVDMGDELEDETEVVSGDDVDYGELNEYEDLTKDINKNKGASLWKIIKVRYKKSAWDDLLPKRRK